MLEKTNVKLADSLFHSSTINALIYYSSHGYPEFNYTADFLPIVRNWFNMMNVKTFYHGQQTRDELRKPITNETRHYMKLYLQSFNKWLSKWKENPDMKELSRPILMRHFKHQMHFLH